MSSSRHGRSTKPQLNSLCLSFLNPSLPLLKFTLGRAGAAQRPSVYSPVYAFQDERALCLARPQPHASLWKLGLWRGGLHWELCVPRGAEAHPAQFPCPGPRAPWSPTADQELGHGKGQQLWDTSADLARVSIYPSMCLSVLPTLGPVL